MARSTISLARRAVTAVLAIEFLCAASFSGLALLHEHRTRLRAFDIMLGGRSDSLLGAVQDAEDPQDNVTVDPTELQLPPQDVYAVYNRGGSLLGSSAKAAPELIERHGDGFRTERAHGTEYRVLQREALRIIDREESGGAGLRRPVTLIYAAPTTHIRHEVLEAAAFYIVVSLVLVSLTAALLILVLRDLVHPISRLAAAADGVEVSSPDFHPPAEATRIRELEPLIRALSGTIGRLREALQAEHRFIGDAAHELKTAVAVVRSSVQVLSMRSRSGEEYRSGLERILRDNERVEGVVSRMLTLARFEERSQLTAGASRLAGPVQQAIASVRDFATLHRISLSTEIDETAQARLTPDAVDVLVSNLVMNAVQHSRPGSEVNIHLAADLKSEVTVLEVSDEGTGISAADLPHVFERFFRADTSRSRETGGAGLGLAICKSIVEGAGGTIHMRSEPGRGTTVTVSFISA